MQPDGHRSWWGGFEVPAERILRWRIGPLTLWIQRLEPEWRVAHEGSGDPFDQRVEVAVPAEPLDLLTFDTVVRFATSRPGGVVLTPMLADRPVVSRPERPFEVPAGEDVTVYVSTPLWVRIDAGTPTVRLHEVPLLRPSDTWFGSSTREGEVCYASRASFRLTLRGLPFRPHRATTAIRVRNRTKEPLLLERVNLPAPNLSLFLGEDGFLWTQSVTLERLEGQEFAAVTFGPTPPAEVRAGPRVSAPRVEPPTNLVVRAFASLFR